ncbi:Uncharacterised protein [Chryseobacterium nakagawai]|uniref:Uncharacterized protein n=1 Tax=Chryseobacterium nakagawai TaxID=1241982 RepID=A0AAD0YJI3_CHRNA|nr:hypothetical protein [Chryseobacterium nakagawai]AZA90465.1 hypothetical protein EG343_07455 [Chryseobacterium nakagawai]VEH21964.1 Uncharacterised protein [Chryseobacterium nakagawai]
MKTISYENVYGQLITEEEIQSAQIFTRIIKVDSIAKIKEEFFYGKLSNVVFYQEGETIDEIFGQYPELNVIDIAKRKEVHGNYVIEEIFGYCKNEGLKLHSFNINDVVRGKTICFGDYDSQTGNIILKSVMKIQYDQFLDIAYYFYYNSLGKIDRIEEVSGERGYNEYSQSYYNNVLPLFPEI